MSRVCILCKGVGRVWLPREEQCNLCNGEGSCVGSFPDDDADMDCFKEYDIRFTIDNVTYLATVKGSFVEKGRPILNQNSNHFNIMENSPDVLGDFFKPKTKKEKIRSNFVKKGKACRPACGRVHVGKDQTFHSLQFLGGNSGPSPVQLDEVNLCLKTESHEKIPYSVCEDYPIVGTWCVRWRSGEDYLYYLYEIREQCGMLYFYQECQVECSDGSFGEGKLLPEDDWLVAAITQSDGQGTIRLRHVGDRIVSNFMRPGTTTWCSERIATKAPPAPAKPTLECISNREITLQNPQLKVNWIIPDVNPPIRHIMVCAKPQCVSTWKYVDTKSSMLTARDRWTVTQSQPVKAPSSTVLIKGLQQGVAYDVHVIFRTACWGHRSPTATILLKGQNYVWTQKGIDGLRALCSDCHLHRGVGRPEVGTRVPGGLVSSLRVAPEVVQGQPQKPPRLETLLEDGLVEEDGDEDQFQNTAQLFPALSREASALGALQSFTWRVSWFTIQRKKVGEICYSPLFYLEGLPGRLRVIFCPKVESGCCSLFIQPEERSITLQLQVHVNGTCRLMDQTKAVEFGDADRRSRGWNSFCASPKGDTSIRVVLLHLGSGTAAKWNVPERYELSKSLGNGGFGSVREAWDTVNNEKIAIKQLFGVFSSVKFCKNIVREVGLLRKLQHPNVLSISDVFLDQTSPIPTLYIVMEHCVSDLHDIIHNSKGVSLHQARKLIRSLIVGCAYLHSVHVYHRDLKPANCLVVGGVHVKICDFNQARSIELENTEVAEKKTDPETVRVELVRAVTARFDHPDVDDKDSVPPTPMPLEHGVTAHICTSSYRAPEVILKLGYDHTIDVWGVGCILTEVFRALNEGGRFPQSSPLFTSSSCWPLDGEMKDGDLLSQIFDVFGTPFDCPAFLELPSITQQHLCRYTPRPGRGLKGEIPMEAGEDGLSLLQQMLCFFHRDRSPMKDCLAHGFFEGIPNTPIDDIDHERSLQITYDETGLGTLKDVEMQLRREIEHHKVEASAGA